MPVCNTKNEKVKKNLHYVDKYGHFWLWKFLISRNLLFLKSMLLLPEERQVSDQIPEITFSGTWNLTTNSQIFHFLSNFYHHIQSFAVPILKASL